MLENVELYNVYQLCKCKFGVKNSPTSGNMAFIDNNYCNVFRKETAVVSLESRDLRDTALMQNIFFLGSL